MRYRVLTPAWLFGAMLCGAAQAQEFAALVSPPRFELSAKPGQTLRHVFELNNRSVAPTAFLFRTADWTLGPDFGVIFADDLQPSSCREWVALERPEVTLSGGAVLRYRFEVAVPTTALVGECRFAVLIESKVASVAKAGAMSVPIAGRIGVIVYVTVGDAAPHLEILGSKRIMINGREVPALRVRNTGTAHGRMSGFLSGTDATGKEYDFNPTDFPVLSGEEADVFLLPSTATDEHPALAFPVMVRGTLEWGHEKTDLHQRFP